MKHKETLISTAAMLLAATLCSSCVTQPLMDGSNMDSQYPDTSLTERLWAATSADNDVIEVPFSELFETDLVQGGLAYTKNEEREYYYIEGSSGERTKDRILRILGTPLTVTADLCLGGAVLYAMAIGGAI